jgi:hypothetical protein
MTTTTIPVDIICSCGSTQFHRPENPQPSDVITCVGCGASARCDEIVRQAGEKARDLFVDELKKAFRNSPFK